MSKPFNISFSKIFHTVSCLYSQQSNMAAKHNRQDMHTNYTRALETNTKELKITKHFATTVCSMNLLRGFAADTGFLTDRAAIVSR